MDPEADLKSATMQRLLHAARCPSGDDTHPDFDCIDFGSRGGTSVNGWQPRRVGVYGSRYYSLLLFHVPVELLGIADNDSSTSGFRTSRTTKGTDPPHGRSQSRTPEVWCVQTGLSLLGSTVPLRCSAIKLRSKLKLRTKVKYSNVTRVSTVLVGENRPFGAVGSAVPVGWSYWQVRPYIMNHRSCFSKLRVGTVQ